MAGIISKAANAYFTYKFLRTLVTPWENQDAYKYGIIDKNGKVLKRARTLINSDEKASYSIFHRLAFNLKRVLEKIPFGKTRLASYAAALYLIKEHTGCTDAEIRDIMEQVDADMLTHTPLNEWFVSEDLALAPGEYQLVETVCSPINGEEIAFKGTSVFVEKNNFPIDTVSNQAIYEVKHIKSNSKIYVTSGLLKR